MIQITEIDQKVNLTVNPITEVINIEITEIRKPVFIVAENDPTPAPTLNQNNIPLKIEILSDDLITNNIDGFVSYFNELNPNLTVLETNSLVQFLLTDTSQIYQLVGVGKGIYGIGKAQITSQNVLKYENKGNDKYTFSFPIVLPNGDTYGQYINGDVATFTDKTIPEIIQQIGQKVLNPTLINPTFTISLPNYTQREVGSTYSEIMTAAFNRGQIKGKLVAGVWQENTQQDFRAGVPSTYTLDGSLQVGNTKTVSKVLDLGDNVFSGSVNFLTGVQPTNSAGENFDSPYAPGTLSDSKIIPADYPVFYGTLLPSQDINDVDLATFTKITNINANNTVSIPYSSVVDKKLVILIPSEKTVKTKWYVDELNSANIGGFGDLFPNPTTENYVSPTALWASKSFKVYISTPTTLNLPIQLRN